MVQAEHSRPFCLELGRGEHGQEEQERSLGRHGMLSNDGYIQQCKLAQIVRYEAGTLVPWSRASLTHG